MARSVRLLSAAPDTTTGSTFGWDGGEGGLFVQGTWGGASVTLQAAPVSPLSGLTLTPVNTDIVATSAEPYVSFNDLPSGSVRAVVAGGDGTTSLTAVIARK
jgi:hypothetical protein